MGHRRKSRELALQGLYMHEVSGTPLKDILTFDWTEWEMSDDIRGFAEILIKGAIEHVSRIDELIVTYSKNWKIERLNAVDKAILRISIYALLYRSDIPSAVTINEGIELGKIYGGEGSGQFINGILDAVKNSELREE